MILLRVYCKLYKDLSNTQINHNDNSQLAHHQIIDIRLKYPRSFIFVILQGYLKRTLGKMKSKF